MKVKVIPLLYIFQVLYVLCFTMPTYQVSVYRTIGPLVLIFALNHRLWVLVRTLTCAHSLCFKQNKNKKCHNVSSDNYHFYIREKSLYVDCIGGFSEWSHFSVKSRAFCTVSIKPTIQTNHFIKNRWYTCLKYNEKMRHANLIDFMGSLLLHSELQTHTIRRTQF